MYLILAWTICEIMNTLPFCVAFGKVLKFPDLIPLYFTLYNKLRNGINRTSRISFKRKIGKDYH